MSSYAIAKESDLENRDYTIIIDKSGSMNTRDVKGKSRWEAVWESTRALAEKVSAYDPDGLTLYTFAGSFKRYDNVGPEMVDQIFRENEPLGSTDLAQVLEHAFENYKQRKRAGQTKNGEIVLVITDGVPDDERAVANTIKNFTKTLNDDKEFGISFLQIGKDGQASKFLGRLDDDLQKEGAKFDIVDTKTFEQMENTTITEVLLGALND